jgi:3-oxoacyl-[acyl-carrier-protein] synthase-3
MGNVIIGTGVAVPPNVVTNHDLARIMDTSDEWIVSRSGVRSRRFVEPGTGASDLAIEASAAALNAAGLEPSDIDVLVTATMTPDVQAPGIVARVQHELGLGNVAGFDLRQQCSGFLYGLDLADAMLTAGRGRRALVVGAEVHAGFLPWGDTWDIVLGRSDRAPTDDEFARNTEYRAWSVLFGDGAGAVVLESDTSEGVGFLSSDVHTDGSQFELILVPGIGSKRRPYADVDQIADDLHLPQMDGAGLYRSAVRLMPEALESAVSRAGLTLADVDIVVAHQANERILDGVRKKLGVSADVVPSNIGHWGNTTAGTLPILFHELRDAGRIPPGAVVAFVAFGAGAHWGAMVYREPDARRPEHRAESQEPQA